MSKKPNALNSEDRFYKKQPHPFLKPKGNFPVDIVYITQNWEERAI